MQSRNPPLPALTVKLSKYNVDDVALGVCKTGAEEAGVTEVRTSLSEKDRKSGSAGMPRPISYAVFCLKKKIDNQVANPAAALARLLATLHDPNVHSVDQVSY